MRYQTVQLAREFPGRPTWRPALALLAVLAAAGAAQAQGAPRGRILFLRCASCHDISSTASPKIGPNLSGVFGRKAGSLPGYNYSPAMKAQTFVWDEAHLDQWLTRPNELVPGTAMAFGGLPAKADREALIAYLRKPAP
jgi:cytochrome c